MEEEEEEHALLTKASTYTDDSIPSISSKTRGYTFWRGLLPLSSTSTIIFRRYNPSCGKKPNLFLGRFTEEHLLSYKRESFAPIFSAPWPSQNIPHTDEHLPSTKIEK